MALRQKTNVVNVCGLGSIYDGDDAKLFRKCLESLLNQTVSIDLYLVVDGPIRDELLVLISEYSHLFRDIKHLPDNLGLAAALNLGMEKIPCSFTHVIRFDADDFNIPERFELIIDALTPETDLFYSSMHEHDVNEGTLKYRKAPTSLDLSTFKYTNPIFHPTVAFRLSKMRLVGGYDLVAGFEDWSTWIKFMKSGCSTTCTTKALIDFSVTSDLVSRRYGLAYLRKEYDFFKLRRSKNYFSIFDDYIFLFSRMLKFVLGKYITRKMMEIRKT